MNNWKIRLKDFLIEAEFALRDLALNVTPDGTDECAVIHQWLYSLANNMALFAEEKVSKTQIIECLAKSHLPSDSLTIAGLLKIESKPKDLTFIDLFAGIGGIRLGFESVGYNCVFSSEWDKYASKTYFENFKELPFGDITKIDPTDIPNHDILLAGFPCQPFSIIGDKAGFDHETQGTLFFNIEEIIRIKKPFGFMLENVRNLTAHDGGKTFKVILSHLERLGYHVHFKVLNALDYAVPQKRERIIIVGFRESLDFTFPPPIPHNMRAKIVDILEPTDSIDRTLFVKEAIRDRRNEAMKKKPDYVFISHENVAGAITPHDFSCALRAGASANYLLINNERRPSPRELLRIQGFPDTYKNILTYGHIKKQTGNSVAVPVIKAVAHQMKKSIDKYFEMRKI